MRRHVRGDLRFWRVVPTAAHGSGVDDRVFALPRRAVVRLSCTYVHLRVAAAKACSFRFGKTCSVVQRVQKEPTVAPRIENRRLEFVRHV